MLRIVDPAMVRGVGLGAEPAHRQPVGEAAARAGGYTRLRLLLIVRVGGERSALAGGAELPSVSGTRS